MTDLEKYLHHLADRKARLVKKRLPVVDEICEVGKIVKRAHNAKIKIKTDALDICITNVTNYMNEVLDDKEA